ncbi:hypothetical protein F4779DRAFT_145684 [Xylariaceae sp. FL0662B]|nr:hypothetical protein F4779DRAFT_145684 [Xylariaceae sp. FL0662B]
MTEPAVEQPSLMTTTATNEAFHDGGGGGSGSGHPRRGPNDDDDDNNNNSNINPTINPSPSLPAFAPIFALVNNTSTRTTHHPHVRYIFSDDDPDVLTRELAELDPGVDASASDPALNNRAMILDLAADDGANIGGGGGGVCTYDVAWAASLSPSWAVLGAHLSPISPPSSSDGGNGEGRGGRPDRLMLRIEGVEAGGPGGSEGELLLRASGEASTSKQGTPSGSRSGSGSGNGHGQKAAEAEDYAGLVDEFERRMGTLRKVVEAGEERRRKIAVDADADARTPMQVLGEGNS